MKVTNRSFLLFVLPRHDGSYGLELRQRLNGGSSANETVVVRAWGPPLQTALSQVLDALRQSGYRPSDLDGNRRAPFELREDAGVRVGLALLALKPLRRAARIERIAEAIREMPDEEVYYWFSKTLSTPRARRALRLLLAPD